MSENDLWKSNEYLRERNEELEQQFKETEKKIKEYQDFLIDIEDKLDLLNGNKGNLCLYCDSIDYDGKEGINHKSYCIMNLLRNKIKDFHTILKESD